MKTFELYVHDRYPWRHAKRRIINFQMKPALPKATGNGNLFQMLTIPANSQTGQEY